MLTLGTNTADGQPWQLDTKHLLTHACIVGMTGSGKTGLGVVLLEELLLSGVPVLAIDPKGDIGNLALQCRTQADFQQWCKPEKAAAAHANHTQAVQDWLLQDKADRLADLAQQVTIYTPASTAGQPVSILTSLEAPATQDRETIRDRLATVCTGLLDLLGYKPGMSAERVLLATLVQDAWEAGRPASLPGLVSEVLEPEREYIGSLDVETHLKRSKREKLAVALNNLLAAPGFQGWLQGAPLSVPDLLWKEGRPQVAVMSLSHLQEQDRRFFVALLLGEVLAWTRSQPGTDRLRAILYFDEIAGYCPPHPYTPASKPPLLLLLKQARAYGLGLVAATQNPVDLDYKALGNCGLWAIGRLQTERDKGRLIDGLLTGDRPHSKAQVERMLSGAGKRIFCVSNTHAQGQQGFTRLLVRHSLSWLKGPLTRPEVQAISGTAAEVHSGPVDSTAELNRQLDKAVEQLQLARHAVERRLLPGKLLTILPVPIFLKARGVMSVIAGATKSEQARLDSLEGRVKACQARLADAHAKQKAS